MTTRALILLSVLTMGTVLSGCLDDSLDKASVAHASERKLARPDAYYLAVEVTTEGAQGVLLAVGHDSLGRTQYETLHYDRKKTDGVNIPEDGLLDDGESSDLQHHIDELLDDLTEQGLPLSGRFFVASPEYAAAGLGGQIGSLLREAYPDFTVDANTPRLEAEANILTMTGRTDLPLEDLILVDVGGIASLFAIYEPSADTTVLAFNLPYGTRSTIVEVDPLGDLHLRRENQRLRIERLVRESVELPIKKLLRQPDFARRKRVVFMGGLVYKIIRTLEIPLTGSTIDFSRESEEELPAKFKAYLLTDHPDLSRGPNYTAEELYASLTILETVMDEIGDRESAYFFERATWLPGYVLSKLPVKHGGTTK